MQELCKSRGITLTRDIEDVLYGNEPRTLLIEERHAKHYSSQLEDFLLVVCVLFQDPQVPFHSLIIRNFEFPKPLIKTLSVALKNNTDIEELVLINLGLQDDDLMSLSIALQENKAIQRIDLAANQITEQGCETLSYFFELNSRIREVSLSQNLIAHFPFATVLKNCLHVKSLALAFNPLHSQACEVLFEVLRHNKSLKKLDIRGIPFDMNSLAKMVEQNTTLEELGIDIPATSNTRLITAFQ